MGKIFDESGFTGLNIERAVQNIKDFDKAANEFARHVDGAFAKLYEFLNMHWASENAVTFTTENTEEINHLITKVTTTLFRIVTNADSAASMLAHANGATFPLQPTDLLCYIDPGESYVYFSHLEPCKEDINGDTGMDTEGVKNEIANFKTSISSCLNEADSLPDGIAFYDSNGDLLKAYSSGVKAFKQEISDLADKTSQKICEYVITEADNILLAKQRATDILNG